MKWSSALRTGAALVGATALAMLAAACGGGSPATRSVASASAFASASHPSAIAFARCMRSHGVQHWPDPDANGNFNKAQLSLQQLGVAQSQLDAAQSACQHLDPNGQSTQAGDQKMMNAMFQFARCVRSHRVPNWPDPVAESDPGEANTPGFPREMPGINQNAPQVRSAIRTCQHLMASIGYGSQGYP